MAGRIDIEQFKIDKNRGLDADAAGSAEAFGPGGKRVDPGSPLALAKVSRSADGRVVATWVRMSTDAGPPRMFDPFEDDVKDLSEETPFLGRPKFDFRKVEQGGYERYLKFLVSGHPAELRMAEREAF